MKYQNYAIIFILIIVPISVVLSYYIQTQTDTLALETKYKTKLNDSTYDAIAAYQMNSLNTQQVTGESVKSYVLASVNTFFTTLATNMGMSSASKKMLLSYVPAILFTTYDGYYIYSPTKTHVVATIPGGLATGDPDVNDAGQPVFTDNKQLIYLKTSEGYERVAPGSDSTKPNVGYDNIRNLSGLAGMPAGVTLNPSSTDVEYNYMLKPFIYYSGNYVSPGNYNLTVSYTLDNYTTVYGNKNTGRPDAGLLPPPTGYGYTYEFTKSGYLLDASKIRVEGELLLELRLKNETDNSTPEYNRESESEYYKQGTTDEQKFQAIEKANKGIDVDAKNAQNHTRYLRVHIGDASTGSLDYLYVNYYNLGTDEIYDMSNPDGGDPLIFSPNVVRYDTSQHVGTGTKSEPVRIQTGDKMIEDTLAMQRLFREGKLESFTNFTLNNENFAGIRVFYKDVEITDYDAMEYYIKAYYYSYWVQRNLSDVTANTIDTTPISTDVANAFAYTLDFDADEIFNIISNPENNPEEEDSLITQHKRAVIKNSIQFNLNTSISTFNNNHGVSEENIPFVGYELPQISTYDWNNILNNICMVSFMQGVPCGTTTFNDYAVVKSNNNNTSVSLDNMYFTKDIGDETGLYSYDDRYHKIDCENLSDSSVPIYEADQSAEFKYDAIKIKSKIRAIGVDEEIICFYDDSTGQYYEAKEIVPGAGHNIGNFDENLTIGQLIPKNSDYTTSWGDTFTYEQLTELPTGTKAKYLYDHRNEACYECIIGANYEPVVTFYQGELYPTYQSETGEMLMLYGDDPYNSGVWKYMDGVNYDGSRIGNDPDVSLTNVATFIANGDMIPQDELNRRRLSVYTYIAKLRNNLYKTNDHVNR